MKILLVTQYFWPESFVINSLTEELIQRGHSVEVYTGLPNYPEGELFSGYSPQSGPWSENYKGAEVTRIPLRPRKKGFKNLALNYLSFVVSGFLNANKIKEKNPDVIFCFGLSPVTSCLPAIYFRWKFKKKLVYWVQDLWPESVSAVGATQSPIILSAIGSLVRWIYKRCDVILMQSEAFRQSIESLSTEADKKNKKLIYIPNWADEFPQISQEPQWIHELPTQFQNGFKIGFAGNIGKAQDMNTLIETAKILKDQNVKWIIAGDGSEKKWVDQQIEKYQLQNCVLTVGRKPYAEMNPLFQKCDALYVSLTNEYIFSLTVPSKVQAYMSAAKPLLASLNGEGARLILEAQAGFVAPAESPYRLAEEVKKLMNCHIDERNKMGQNGKKYFENYFTRTKVMTDLENILKQSVISNQL